MNRPFLFSPITTGMSALAIVLGAYIYLLAPSHCQEKAFQASKAFGTNPRRFFEIEKEKGSIAESLWKIKYVISFQLYPLLKVSVSPWTCKKMHEEEIPTEEGAKLHEQNIKKLSVD